VGPSELEAGDVEAGAVEAAVPAAEPADAEGEPELAGRAGIFRRRRR
jgi:hypothetical protein